MDGTPESAGRPNVPGAATPLRLRDSAEWRAVRQSFLASGDARAAYTAITGIVEKAVRDAAAIAFRGGVQPATALVALGGFGRGELFPCSEVDVLVLKSDEVDAPEFRAGLTEFERLLWDSGLRLNHSARTVAATLEACARNSDFALALLDQCLVAGDADLHAKLSAHLPPLFAQQQANLVAHVCGQARTRWERFAGTPYHLEPDVRDAPGGLRDLGMLRQLELLAPDQYPSRDMLGGAASTAAVLRCYLHFQRGMDSNVFDYSAQADIAAAGFAAGRGGRAMMHDYLSQAAAVYVAAYRVLDLAGRGGSALAGELDARASRLSNADFTVVHSRIFLRNPGQLESAPGIVLRLFEFIARHGLAPAAETERRLEAARAVLGADLSSHSPVWPALRIALAQPHAGMALRALQRTGLLTLLLPGLAERDGLAVPDPARRFTSEEEALRSIDQVDAWREATDGQAQRFADFLSELDTSALLVFALLYAAAGAGADAPEARSLELARTAAERVGMSADERAVVEFLVAHQSDLAEVTRGLDIGNPATARSLAERAATVENLKQLAVLTFARHAVLKPDAGAAWRVEQIWRAYRAVQHELTRELETDRIQDAPPERGSSSAFLVGFPVRYARTHSPAEIQAHIDLYEVSRPTGVAVRLDRIEGAWRLTVIAPDRPALFASFAGAISSFGLDILKAEAFSNSAGVILDTFLLADPKHALERNPGEVDRLRDLVRRVALGKTTAQRLLRNRLPHEAGAHAAPPQVFFDSEASATATLVEISALDRPGLLYSLASVFSSSGCNIGVVLIDTKGHRASDVFYVSYQGHKLSAGMQTLLHEKLTAAC